jgi:hypothetical protein
MPTDNTPLKVKVVPHREDVNDLDANESIIHLAFRPDVKDVLHIMDLCPRLAAIEVPKSYFNTLSRAIPILLKMRNIKLLAGEVQGHRRDLNAYFPIPPQILDMVINLKSAGTPEDQIMIEVKKTHLINPDLAEFIVKTYKQG